MKQDYRIIHIIPANGWNVVLLSTRQPFYRVEPLAAWAVIERKGETEFVGITRYGDVSNDMPNWEDHIHQEHITPEKERVWSVEGADWAERHQEAR